MMADSGSKNERELSPKQEKLISCLLAAPLATVAVISTTCGISERTAYRWLRDPEVQRVLRREKTRLFQATLDALQDEIMAALRVHIEAKVEPNAQTQLRAIEIWANLQQGLLQADIEQRLAVLEEREGIG